MEIKLETIWEYNEYDHKLRDELSKRLGVSSYLAQILNNRKVIDYESACSFINPTLNNLEDPYLIPGIDTAVSRIYQAIKRKEGILIYGDYDVDGITSAVMLDDYLQQRGCLVDIYIPSRAEGYGLNKDTLKKLAGKDFSLIITVDCGTNNYDEIDYAKKIGFDVIVTDHHNPGVKIPKAISIVNPKLGQEENGMSVLSGAGVVFKLIQSLEDGKIPVQYLDLVTLGTIADVVPIIGENRNIIAEGVKQFCNTKRPGLQALIDVSGFRDKTIQVGQIAYGLAPRLNASGRIDEPLDSIKLLKAMNMKEAMPLAKSLDKKNRARQKQQEQTLDEALSKIKREINLQEEKAILLYKEDWNPGIIGIVASKLVAKFYRPVILFTKKGMLASGSGRSIDSFHLLDALQDLGDLLENFGGHKLAAGLSLPLQGFRNFKDSFLKIANKRISDDDLKPRLNIDLILDQSEVTEDLAREINLLAPFGNENPSPVIVVKNAGYQSIKTLSNGKHLKFDFPTLNSNFEVIGFNYGLYLNELKSRQDNLNIAFKIEKNYFKRIEKYQLKLIDLKFEPKCKETASFINNLYSRAKEFKIETRYLKYSDCLSFKNKEDSTSSDNLNSDSKKSDLSIPRNIRLFDKRNIKSKNNYLKVSIKRGGKSLILSNKPDKCVELANFLRKEIIYKENEIAFYHSGLNKADRIQIWQLFRDSKIDTLISTYSFMENISILDIRSLYLYDLPFNYSSLKKVTSIVGLDNQLTYIHILFGKGDILENDLMLESISPSRKSLAIIYRSLRELAENNIIFHGSRREILDHCQKNSRFNLLDKTFQNSLLILEESGLIKLEDNREKIWIELKPEPDKKIDLNISSRYLEGEKKREEFSDFKKWIFNTEQSKLLAAFYSSK